MHLTYRSWLAIVLLFGTLTVGHSVDADQSSAGPCSPNIENVTGNVSIKCDDLSDRALAVLNNTISQRFTEIDDKLIAAAEWRQEYLQLQSQSTAFSSTPNIELVDEMIERGSFAIAKAVLDELHSYRPPDPQPSLSIIDTFSFSNLLGEKNTVNFKLKNSGADSAFLTEVRFVVLEGSMGNRCCSLVGIEIYGAKVNAIFEDQKVEVTQCLSEIISKRNESRYGAFGLYYNEGYECSAPSAQFSYAIKEVGGSSSILFSRLLDEPTASVDDLDPVPFSLVRANTSDAIKISQVVPPRGVTQFNIKFDFDFKPMVICCGVVESYELYAIIKYDGHRFITTPTFRISNDSKERDGPGVDNDEIQRLLDSLNDE